MSDATSEEVEGKTPNGGVRSVAYFLDAEGNPCPKAQASRITIVELDEAGEPIFRTYLEKKEKSA